MEDVWLKQGHKNSSTQSLAPLGRIRFGWAAMTWPVKDNGDGSLTTRASTFRDFLTAANQMEEPVKIVLVSVVLVLTIIHAPVNKTSYAKAVPLGRLKSVRININAWTKRIVAYVYTYSDATEKFHEWIATFFWNMHCLTYIFDDKVLIQFQGSMLLQSD